MSNTWQLQDAKNRLSEVVDRAREEGVQVITRRGRPAVVVLSVDDYERLRPRGERLVDVLRDCPAKDLEIYRVKDQPREPEL